MLSLTCERCAVSFLAWPRDLERGRRFCSWKCWRGYDRDQTTEQTIARFWALARKTKAGCWLWRGHLSPSGYGVFTWRGRWTRAHRLAYELTSGAIPAGTLVCHRCDVRRCINPAHLYAGSAFDNMRDAAAAGKTRGSRNGRARLDDDQVRAIRELAAIGVKQAELARRFGVPAPTVNHIVHRRTWKHLG
jgi:hypothetical protein